jgi:hypothetical protein
MIERESTRINHLYSIYLKIPNLSDLAWNSLLTAYPNLIKTDKRKLLNSGLPVNFINKIN